MLISSKTDGALLMCKVRGLLIRASGRVFPFRETESSGSPWKHISGSCFAPTGIFELAAEKLRRKARMFQIDSFFGISLELL